MDLKPIRGNTKEDVILVHAFHDGIVILVHLKNQLCWSCSQGEGLSWLVAENNDMSFFQPFQYCLGLGLGTIGDFSSEQLLNDLLKRELKQDDTLRQASLSVAWKPTMRWRQGRHRPNSIDLHSGLTWRHGGHISVPKQWNCGHVGVPNQSCGSWKLLSYVNDFFCSNKFA